VERYVNYKLNVPSAHNLWILFTRECSYKIVRFDNLITNKESDAEFFLSKKKNGKI